MTSDNDSASTSGLVLDDLVSTLQSLLVVGSPQLIGEGVGTDSTEVGGRSFGENVLPAYTSVSSRLDCCYEERAEAEEKEKQTNLSTTSSVLSGSTSNVVDLVVLLKVIVAV